MKSQERLASKVPNFHYNLGFSGFYYKSGSADENEGDELLLKYAKKFWWFPHMYKHLKPHKFANKEELVQSMKKNKAFAVVSFIISRSIPDLTKTEALQTLCVSASPSR